MRILLLTFVITAITACTNSVKHGVPIQEQEFFPVNSFLKGQVHEVDSFKLPIRKYSTSNDKTDSLLISQEEFNSLAKEFMEPDINDPTIKKFYKETSFADQSIPNVTFTYSTDNKELSLRRMDVIVNPDPVLNDQVSSIYLEKITDSGDTSEMKKLHWKTNKYFQNISSKQTPGHPAIFSTIKVAWGASD